MSDWISTSTPENRLIARVLHRKLAKLAFGQPHSVRRTNRSSALACLRQD